MNKTPGVCACVGAWTAGESQAWEANKRRARQALSAGMMDRLGDDMEAFGAQITSAPLQAVMGKYMESLAKKK